LRLAHASALAVGEPVPFQSLVAIDVIEAGNTAMGILTASTDPEARWRAVRILRKLRYHPAVPLLLKALSDKHRYVRSNAAGALGDMRVKAAAKPLTELLKRETDGAVIAETSGALVDLGAREAVPALRAVAKHESALTRQSVLGAIGVLGTRRDVAFVAQFLDDPSLSVQAEAAKQLERMAGVRFGLPEGSGPLDITALLRARRWWKENQKLYSDP
jgi:HEAT repeat protein